MRVKPVPPLKLSALPPALRLTERWSGMVVAALLSLLLAACASTLPPRGPASNALAPRPDSPFAAVEAALATSLAPGHSGFRLLARNEDALLWRLALIDTARHSLDLQYYVWFGDKSGELLMARVIAAANRGVRVRILFDDLNSLLHNMDSVELRDTHLAQIDRHPNIEIRLFNPWTQRSLPGRFAEMFTDFSRLNRRMHNKQLIADNRVTIIGGRNIGDEYLGLNEKFNFHDLDVLGAGPVARQASAVFDRYWNSDWVRRVPLLPPGTARVVPSEASQQSIAELRADERGRRLLAGRNDWKSAIARLAASLHPGQSSVHTDSPVRDGVTRNHMPDAFRTLLRSARREVLITNAYIIPDPAFVAELQALTTRGVRVRILTNSLESQDVPAVNSHYEPWRQTLLDVGVELYELRADAALRRATADTPPVQAGFVGLHVKAMTVDRTRMFVGSMNLDARSEFYNSEMGVLIDSAGLAEALSAQMEQDMAPANSWRVTQNADKSLQWQSDAGTLSAQPARSFWQRVQNVAFKLLPSSLY